MAEATDASLKGQSDNDSEHGTSTEYLDPWCDICFDKTGDRIRPDGFCPDCNSFMCGSCTDHHKLWPTLKTHKILRGRKMPKSQADKPVKYPICTAHAGNVKDYYCVPHCEIVCSQCREQTHGCCRSMSLSDMSKNLGAVHIQQFENDIVSLKEHITSAKKVLETNVSDMDKQKENIIKQAKDNRDNIVSKAEMMFEDTVSMVSQACKQKKLHLADQILSLEEIIHSLDEIAFEINKKLDFTFDQNIFIQMHEIVANLRERETEIDNIKKELYKITLTLSTSSDVSAFLSAGKHLGVIKELNSEFDSRTSLPKISFPQRKRSKDISKLKCHKIKTFNIRTREDKKSCQTLGMNVTTEGILLLSDMANKSLKVFSEDKKLLSRLSFPTAPGPVGVVDNRTAVISTTDEKLYILNISDKENISIDRSVSLKYWAFGLKEYGDKLLVVSRGKQNSVKLIDQSGCEKWSVSDDSNGESLFESNRSITVTSLDDTLKLIVTDWGKQTLTILNPRDGELLDVIDVKGKSPNGITSDNDGNVYVCYYGSKEICIFAPDFRQSHILLSKTDLSGIPVDIIFNGALGEIYISYLDNDTVDCFQLT